MFLHNFNYIIYFLYVVLRQYILWVTNIKVKEGTLSIVFSVIRKGYKVKYTRRGTIFVKCLIEVYRATRCF